MNTPGHVGVIDIGKTNAKVAVVDLDRMEEVDVVTTPNRVIDAPPYPHYDIEGLWQFLLDGLARHHAQHGLGAISITTHGASVVLLDANGGLAAPMLDYEHDGPDRLAAEYDALRPEFSVTGSPRLPCGLNVGAQLLWQLETLPGLRDRLENVVTYPQYWGFRLTGDIVTEVTSLGCHTDLWEPQSGRFSDLPAKLGLAGKIAPVRRAADRIGTLLPEVARRTGIPADTPVSCGIHDSNASLYPHLLALAPPFSVLSTGTWVIAMTIGGRSPKLDPARDTLINVNAIGQPVPSARFMGGREFEILSRGDRTVPNAGDIDTVLSEGILLMPSTVPDSGPYPGRAPSWSVDARALTAGQRMAAISLYLAMMASTCLEMIGADGPTLTEGPFGRNALFLDMLAVASGRPVLLPGGSATGTSIGAALLALGEAARDTADQPVPHPAPDTHRIAGMTRYAAAWRRACNGTPAPGHLT